MRPVPRGATASHYDLLSAWWSVRDPAYAAALQGEAVLAALIAEPDDRDPDDPRTPVGMHEALHLLTRTQGAEAIGTARMQDPQGWTVEVSPDAWTTIDAEHCTVEEDDVCPAHGIDEVEHFRTETIAVLRLTDGRWASVVAAEDACDAEPSWEACSLAVTATIGEDLQGVLAAGFTRSQRALLLLPLAHEDWSLDDLTPAQ